jgi:hypothetical protein
MDRERFLSCHTCCGTDLSFSVLISRTAPFSCLLKHARGYRGPITTEILTGPIRRGKKRKEISIKIKWISKV